MARTDTHSAAPDVTVNRDTRLPLSRTGYRLSQSMTSHSTDVAVRKISLCMFHSPSSVLG